jgi:hypothetical protein
MTSDITDYRALDDNVPIDARSRPRPRNNTVARSITSPTLLSLADEVIE